MKHLTILLFGLVLLGSYSCQKASDDASKPPVPSGNFTVQGRLFDTFPGKPYIHVPVTIFVSKGTGQSYVEQSLDKSVTNDSGWFSITYPANSMTDGHLTVETPYNDFAGYAINSNINKDFFHPTKGELQINLFTNNPLETNHDTLFLGYFQQNPKDNGNLDLITIMINNNVDGIYKTIPVQLNGFRMFYGRGWKDFSYNAQIGRFTNNSHYVDCTIHGDPTIDQITINY